MLEAAVGGCLTVEGQVSLATSKGGSTQSGGGKTTLSLGQKEYHDDVPPLACCDLPEYTCQDAEWGKSLCQIEVPLSKNT